MMTQIHAEVSDFRKYVIEHRFSTPYYDENLTLFLERVKSPNTPPIAFVFAQCSKSQLSKLPIGVSKADFCNFIPDFFRRIDPTIKVFSFINLDQAVRGSTFYSSIFVPELLRQTKNTADNFLYVTKLAEILFKFIIKRLWLLLRVNVLMLVALITFIFTKISLNLFFEYKTEISNLFSQILQSPALNVLLVLISLIWVIYAWDKVKKEHYVEWSDSSLANLLRIAKAENAYIPPQRLLKRFKSNDIIVFVINNINQIDTESLGILFQLVSPLKAKSKLKEIRPHVGIIFIADESSKAEHEKDSLFSEFRCRVNRWMYFNIYPPTIEEIKWLLGGMYSSTEAEELIDKLLEREPQLSDNTDFLLEFLYNETKGWENAENVEPEDFLYDYQSYINKYCLQIEQILEKIPDEIIIESKEMLKYILAFESPLPNIEKIHFLMETEGYQLQHSKQIADELVSKRIIKIYDGSYAFCNTNEKNILLTVWSEWREDADYYYTRVFDVLHNFSSARDNPILARRCKPNKVIIDTLWNEGDALWFFGGNADVRTALSYYGLETGALGKWILLFDHHLSEKCLSGEDYYWRVEAKNSPFRYKGANRRFSSRFIGDLFQMCAALYFLGGDYSTSLKILTELWEKASGNYWAIAKGNKVIDKEMIDAQEKIAAQLAFYLLIGPARKENIQRAQSLIASMSKTRFSALAEALAWRTKYFARYAIGNDVCKRHHQSDKLNTEWDDAKSPSFLDALCLVRASDINIKVRTNKNVQQRVDTHLVSNLMTLPIRIHHLFDYVNWTQHKSITINLLEILKEVNTLLDYFKNAITTFDAAVNHSINNPYIFDWFGLPLPDAEIFSLAIKSWLEYYKSQTANFLLLALQNRQLSSSPEDKKWFMDFYEIVKSISRDYRQEQNQADYQLNKLREQSERLYKEYLANTDSGREIHPLKNSVLQVLNLVYTKSLENSSKSLDLMEALASIRLLIHDQKLALYTKAKVADSKSTSEELLLHHQIAETEPIIGFQLDSLSFYIRSGYHLDLSMDLRRTCWQKSKEICDSLGDHLPAFFRLGVVLELADYCLRNYQHTMEISENERVIELGNQALSLFNKVKSISAEELIDYERLARVCISESWLRIAGFYTYDNQNPDLIQPCLATVREYLNWLERHSQNTPHKKWFLIKQKEVLGRLLWIGEKRYHDAISIFKSAMALALEEKNLLEILQISQMIVNLRFIVQDNSKEFLQDLEILRRMILATREFMRTSWGKDRYSFKLSTGCVLYGHIALQIPHLKTEAAEIILYGLEGYVELGFPGLCLIELAVVKDLLISLIPEKFDALVRQCISKWDPRIETTDKLVVTKALMQLVKTKMQIEEVLSENDSKIREYERLMARPDLVSVDVYQSLKRDIDLIDIENPSREDIQLLELLLKHRSLEKDFSQIEKYQKLYQDLSVVYANRVYLETAKMFSSFPEIREKYLQAAASGQNKYSLLARQQLLQIIKRDVVLAKEEIENTLYTRLMELPEDEFDFSNALQLIILLEYEMSILIATQIKKQNIEWENAIPKELIGPIAELRSDQIEFIKVLEIEDIFKIIETEPVWENAFRAIFLSRSNLEVKKEIILTLKHQAARPNPDISSKELKKGVRTVKSLILQIRPHLYKYSDVLFRRQELRAMLL